MFDWATWKIFTFAKDVYRFVFTHGGQCKPFFCWKYFSLVPIWNLFLAFYFLFFFLFGVISSSNMGYLCHSHIFLGWCRQCRARIDTKCYQCDSWRGMQYAFIPYSSWSSGVSFRSLFMCMEDILWDVKLALTTLRMYKKICMVKMFSHVPLH